MEAYSQDMTSIIWYSMHDRVLEILDILRNDGSAQEWYEA